MKPLKRYKVKLNSVEKIEELLQELYNESCKFAGAGAISCYSL